MWARVRPSLAGPVLALGVVVAQLLGAPGVRAALGDNILTAQESTFVQTGGGCTTNAWGVIDGGTLISESGVTDGDGCAVRMTGNGSSVSMVGRSACMAATPSVSYTVSGKVRAHSTNGTNRSVRISVQYYLAGGTTGIGSGESSYTAVNSAAWTTLTATATSPANAVCLRIQFQVQGAGNTEKWSVDTLSLSSPSIDPNPTTTTTAAPTTTTTLPPTTTTTVPPTTTTVPETTTTTVAVTTTTTVPPGPEAPVDESWPVPHLMAIGGFTSGVLVGSALGRSMRP